MPTPEELFMARDVIDRAKSVLYEKMYDRKPDDEDFIACKGPDGDSTYEGLVEAKRQVAIATACWGYLDPAYRAMWERMMEEQG
jgi:hypothetical protein